jgi:iron complex transport system substrate-binding protein
MMRLWNTSIKTPALVLASLAAFSTPAWGAPPSRIVSLNLCADQLVLALADREQIAGLTRNARDAAMSAEASRVGDLRLLRTSAEEILNIRPDLVIGMPARRSSSISAGSYRTLDIAPANRLEDIYHSIAQVAAAVGHPDRGSALIARMRSDLARLPRIGRGKVAAYYQRRGFLTGTGTLIDDLMRRLGLVNLASKLGKSPLSLVSLEEMVAARPDYLMVESATDHVTDQGSEMLHHPALRNIPRISIPQAWTVCGSPAYVTAARSITAQIAELERRR